MNQILTFSNRISKKFFFTTNFSQRDTLTIDWKTNKHTLPIKINPTSALPLGIISNKEDFKKAFHTDLIEIPNPNPMLQG